MKLLVTGGAGYVGSHSVKNLIESGHDVVVYDNLVLGHREAVGDVPLVVGDVLDRELLTTTLLEHRVEGVLHFAARSRVGESVQDPGLYYRENVGGTISLLEAMRATGVQRLVFSSTCATYGEPKTVPIMEETPQNPVNPYGRSKLMVEQILADYSAAYGFGAVALRYFNACGAAPDGRLGESHEDETHLIPIVLQVAASEREAVTVFGTDYATPDGTCIRDYIHVEDLAEAHRLAIENTISGEFDAMNLGTGRGFSVKEVIDACRQVTEEDIRTVLGSRRAGDPPELVADPRKAIARLGWRPKFTTIESIIETAWTWHSNRPHGFGTADN